MLRCSAMLEAVVTAIAVAALYWLLERVLPFSLYSLTVWFFPFSTLFGWLIGIVYFVFLYTKQQPAKLIDYLFLIPLGLLFQAELHFLSYVNMRTSLGLRPFGLDGLSFSKYLQVTLENAEFRGSLGNASSKGKIGSLAYLFEGFLLLGFVLGGWIALFMSASGESYCRHCRRYRTREPFERVRYFSSKAEIEPLLKLSLGFTSLRLSADLLKFSDQGHEKELPTDVVKARLDTFCCQDRACSSKGFRLNIQKRKAGSHWKDDQDIRWESKSLAELGVASKTSAGGA